MKRILSLLLALALSYPSLAADKPLVMQGGQIKALPAGDDLQLQNAIILPHITAPASPVNGECWTATAGLYCRISGVTVGPYATGTGSVTSVQASGGATGMSFSGGPITASGTLTLSGTLAVTNGGTGATSAASALSNLGGVATSRSISTGTGLVGGGNLTADRSLSLATSGVTAGSYGSALKVPTITVDAYGRVTIVSENTIPVLASGTYTPTLTNVANVDASGANQASYVRVGNQVTVTGSITVDPTTVSTSTIVGISLPIASNIGATSDANGTAASAGVQQSGAIEGDAANDRAQMRFSATDTANRTMWFTFVYNII